MQDLPSVPEIEAVLEPNQVPHQVGVVSSVSHLFAYISVTRTREKCVASVEA